MKSDYKQTVLAIAGTIIGMCFVAFISVVIIAKSIQSIQ